MTRPTFRMMSSLDPNDHSCTATIEIDGDVIEFEATNQVARKINDAIQRAYGEGRYDGIQAVLAEIDRLRAAV